MKLNLSSVIHQKEGWSKIVRECSDDTFQTSYDNNRVDNTQLNCFNTKTPDKYCPIEFFNQPRATLWILSESSTSLLHSICYYGGKDFVLFIDRTPMIFEIYEHEYDSLLKICQDDDTKESVNLQNAFSNMVLSIICYDGRVNIAIIDDYHTPHIVIRFNQFETNEFVRFLKENVNEN